MRLAIRGVPRARQRDLGRGVVLDRDAEDAGGAAHDHRQLLGLVVAEPERQAEAVAQRRRQQAGAGGRADERERRQVERQRPRGRPLADDDVEPEVLERRIEDLLDRAVDAVDLVDEEDVTQLEAGEDRGHVALPLERRPGDVADADAELLADDLRERRLAEPGRPDEQHVVERLAARLGGRERDRELFLDGSPGRRTRPAGAGGASARAPPPRGRGRPQRRRSPHAACLSASRTRSSAGRSGSTAASACSASTTE